MSFGCTQVVKRLKASECESCKLVDILKHQSCPQDCYGSSRKESLLAASKIYKEIHPSVPSILQSSFAHSSSSLQPEIDSLRSSIKSYRNRVRGIAERLSQVRPSNVKTGTSLSLENKLKHLEEKTNRLENFLNTRAAEVYDLKEQLVPLRPPPQVPPGISELKEETRKLNKRLEERKLHNDGSKIEIYKLKKEKPPAFKQSHLFKKEMENDKLSLHRNNKDLQRLVDKIENKATERTETLGSLKRGIDLIQKEAGKIKTETNGIEILGTEEILKKTRVVFASYFHLKKLHELTKEYIVKAIGNAKKSGSVQSKINNLLSQIQSF